MQLWCALPLIDTVTALPRSPRGLDDHAVWGLPKGLGWRSSQAPMTCWLTGGGGLDLNQRPLGYEGISAPETKQAQPRIAETARDSAPIVDGTDFCEWCFEDVFADLEEQFADHEDEFAEDEP